VLIDAVEGAPELILIATGSEVSLALEAHRQLAGEGVRCRVVSMPSWELFDYIEVFYNQRRRHSTIGQVSPAAFEKARATQAA